MAETVLGIGSGALVLSRVVTTSTRVMARLATLTVWLRVLTMCLPQPSTQHALARVHLHAVPGAALRVGTPKATAPTKCV